VSICVMLMLTEYCRYFKFIYSFQNCKKKSAATNISKAEGVVKFLFEQDYYTPYMVRIGKSFICI
jgi:hypothetical protein